MQQQTEVLNFFGGPGQFRGMLTAALEQSQAQWPLLADYAGLSGKAAIQAFVEGKTNLDRDSLHAIVFALDKPLNELFPYQREPTAAERKRWLQRAKPEVLSSATGQLGQIDFDFVIRVFAMDAYAGPAPAAPPSSERQAQFEKYRERLKNKGLFPA